ncbi:MAG TPA: hypothetical protein VM841_15815 [Actinomycetota bacterium]|nr:hypothetical protein [Actinomycetota bacterium]
MRYEHTNRLGCGDVGRRVTVRSRTADGFMTDAVGVLEECDDRSFVIRTKRGDLIRVERALVVAAKTIPDAPGRPGSRGATGADDTGADDTGAGPV